MSLIRGTSLLMVVAALSAVAAGCGKPQPKSPGGQSTNGVSVETFPVNWDNPLDKNPLGTVPVRDTAAAARAFSFSVLVPQVFGDLRGAFVTDYAGIDPSYGEEWRIIEFVYDHPQYGRVVIWEHAPPLPKEEYLANEEQTASLNGTPDFHGTATLVTLSSGQRALVERSADDTFSAIRWYMDGPGNRDFEIIIRARDVKPGNVTSIAEDLLKPTGHKSL